METFRSAPVTIDIDTDPSKTRDKNSSFQFDRSSCSTFVFIFVAKIKNGKVPSQQVEAKMQGRQARTLRRKRTQPIKENAGYKRRGKSEGK